MLQNEMLKHGMSAEREVMCLEHAEIFFKDREEKELPADSSDAKSEM